MYITLILFALFLGAGLLLLAESTLLHDRSFRGRKTMRQLKKWQSESKNLWDIPIMQKLCTFVSRFVYLDQTEEEKLRRNLNRAGYAITPQMFTARKYVILAFGILGIVLCVILKFWFGLILVALLTGYGMMRQRELLTAKLKAIDEAIAQEMPRFVRTICRNLRSNRDVYAVLQSYRQVAGPVLGAELDILLAEMRSGSVQTALQQFEGRLGSEAAFRLCSALQEVDRGIDQSATLEYLADDMARQAKLEVQKALSTRPAKMRRTYLPAVGVCVAMILYVLVVFVENQLNNLF